MNAILERVAAGAAFLDGHAPGWDQRIDLDGLDIGSRCGCVLGQLHGDYVRGLDAAGIGDVATEVALGFMWKGSGSIREERRWMTAEWKRVITERRAAS